MLFKVFQLFVNSRAGNTSLFTLRTSKYKVFLRKYKDLYLRDIQIQSFPQEMQGFVPRGTFRGKPFGGKPVRGKPLQRKGLPFVVITS